MRAIVAAALTGLFVVGVAAAADVEQIKAKLEAACQADTFSGTAMVVVAGKPVLREACGYSDRESHIAMTTDTPLRIASVGKIFTVVATLQLLEAKKLDLDAPLGRYLRDYPNKELAEKVTIRHLLSHTGGTGDYFGPDFMKFAPELKTHADYIRIFGDRKPAFEPGSQSVYSNFGFILLGRVIEKVSGEDYYSYVQRHIFDRAGMTGASFPIEGQGYARMSASYSGPVGQRTKRTLTIYRAMGSGGGFASAEDLVRFGEAFMAGKLVSKKMVAHIVAGDMKVGDKSYAYGLDRHVDEKGRVILNHGGNGTGINASFRIYPSERAVAVAIANIDQPAAYDAMKEIAAAVE